jgi:CBS domain-containing protein
VTGDRQNARPSDHDEVRHYGDSCHISGVPVVNDDGSLTGIISESDFLRRSEIGTERKRSALLRFFAGAGKLATDFVHERGRKVEDVMTRDPITVNEQTPLSELVELM